MVDHDHQQLIASLNELDEALKQGAGKEQVERIISFLNRYTRDHFAREEEHMKRIGCPAYNENCQEHDAFIAKLDGWVAKLQSGSSTGLVLEIYRETSAWIRGHILKVDCKLRLCQTQAAGR